MKIHPYYFSNNKRIFDALLAVLLLIVLTPLFLLIAAGLLITAGPPILFRQKRTGQNGKTFLLYKFRTMEKNAAMLKHKYQHLNEAPSPMFKIHNDPRFVGIGRLLSRIGLDELPQLWNILKGEMSFVGPRPLPAQEARGLAADWQRWRERVRPGIFSVWAFSKEKHASLEKWKQLEIDTLARGGIQEDFKQAALSLRLILQSFFSR